MIRASIISSAAGSTPAAMMPLTVAAAASTEANAHSIVATARRVGREAHRDPGRDAHRAFRADEAAAQVVAGRVGLEPAEARDLAVGEHDVDREDVRRRDPFGEAVRTARVGADVAADRARLLRRRVGRVVQAEMRDGPRQVEVQHAGLDPRDPLRRRRPRAPGSSGS